jgi:hypothetical protein
MTQSRLILSNDLGEFFKRELSEAESALGIEVSELAECYLVNLLCDYSKRGHNPELGEKPLALQYKRALEAMPAERFHLLKSLGDESLYVAGFFSEFIERSLVDVSYYISMGGNAYGSLSELVGWQRHGSTFARLYEQLATRFPQLVDLLNQVSDRARSKVEDNNDLLKVYERWLRTRSVRLQRILHERGFFVRDVLPDENE